MLSVSRLEGLDRCRATGMAVSVDVAARQSVALKKRRW
jgi:hypothetical protein